MRIFWPLLMIFSFGVLDMATTYLVYDGLGTFSYETGVLPMLFFSLGGIAAVIATKLLLTILCAFSLYYIAIRLPRFDRICSLLCLGASFVGLLSAASNLNGLFTGSTIFIAGIGIDTVAYSVFTIIFIVGMTDVALAYSNGRSVCTWPAMLRKRLLHKNE